MDIMPRLVSPVYVLLAFILCPVLEWVYTFVTNKVLNAYNRLDEYRHYNDIHGL